ncbi:hypothetical protein O4159_20285 [Gordonia terrae]|nr:hypothetical protein [Gordonia terrae]
MASAAAKFTGENYGTMFFMLRPGFVQQARAGIALVVPAMDHAPACRITGAFGTHHDDGTSADIAELLESFRRASRWCHHASNHL